ncbi:hypothetical protein [Micromonospora sp. RP3T]|uniref:hypothetical protein n=1 Tax=Micromonospora sp. RP3T TaxID=2135446 RepID=UPI003D71A709
MTALLVSVAGEGGAELDRLTLDDQGRIAYRTGAARSMVESRRRLAGDQAADDAALLALLDGWSNGYITIRADPTTAAGAGDGDGDEAGAAG